MRITYFRFQDFEPPLVSSDKVRFSAFVLGTCLLGAILLLLCAGIARADIVSTAQSQIGLGELGSNNKGIYVKRYLNGQEGLPWCAGFVSYCAKEAGYKLPYLLRAKSYLKYGQRINDPKAGDLIVFTRQGGGHIGIIEKVSKDTITTIEGNLGAYPAKVKRVNYHREHIKNFTGFVRLAEAR